VKLEVVRDCLGGIRAAKHLESTSFPMEHDKLKVVHQLHNFSVPLEKRYLHMIVDCHAAGLRLVLAKSVTSTMHFWYHRRHDFNNGHISLQVLTSLYP